MATSTRTYMLQVNFITCTYFFQNMHEHALTNTQRAFTCRTASEISSFRYHFCCLTTLSLVFPAQRIAQTCDRKAVTSNGATLLRGASQSNSPVSSVESSPNRNTRLAKMVQQVKEVLPQVPAEAIKRDLSMFVCLFVCLVVAMYYDWGMRYFMEISLCV